MQSAKNFNKCYTSNRIHDKMIEQRLYIRYLIHFCDILVINTVWDGFWLCYAHGLYRWQGGVFLGGGGLFGAFFGSEIKVHLWLDMKKS